MALISVVTPVFNEEENVKEIYEQVKSVFKKFPQHTYEHIFIDNSSKDSTVNFLKSIAKVDLNIKVIINNRNFGHIRSPYHAFLQATGDAVVMICGDLQEPPQMIEKFILSWEKGFKVVLGIKTQSEETFLMFYLRKTYYNILYRISDVKLSKNNTGFGLYDQMVIQQLQKIQDVYPYFRGLISELGFLTEEIEFKQQSRKRGLSKNNIYSLYDIAMLGVTSHSKLPLRLATISGFLLSFVFLILTLCYFLAKILFWDKFPLGIAPIIIGMFFFFSIQLFFIGLLGEYIGAIHTQILKRPLVVEKERINFNSTPEGRTLTTPVTDKDVASLHNFVRPPGKY